MAGVEEQETGRLEELETRIVELEQRQQLLQRTDPAIRLGTNLHDLGLVGEKARAYRSAAQTIGTGAWTKVEFNTISFDPRNDFDAATNYHYTVPIDGSYVILGCVGIAIANDQKAIILAIYVNGTLASYGNQIRSSGAASSYNVRVGDILELTLGDTVDIRLYHTDGANADTSAVAASNYIAIHCIGG